MFSKATRVDCYPLNVEKPLHIFKELTPDEKSVIIENLKERTEYRITITIITEEYFTYHKDKRDQAVAEAVARIGAMAAKCIH